MLDLVFSVLCLIDRCLSFCPIPFGYGIVQGRIQDFKLGGAHLKKLRREKGGAKIFGIFRVKNHDFTPKNHIFPILGGARAGWAPPGSAPVK